MTNLRILALGGDGIGPEVLGAALRVLDRVAAIEGLAPTVEEDLLHGAAWERFGTFCREETVAAARRADAVLVGAVGGPRWDAITVPGGPEMQDGLMRLRKGLDVFAGLRPAKARECLLPLTPYRLEVCQGADVVVLRELCGGVYFSEPRGIADLPGGGRRGFDTTAYDTAEILRIARAGFELARRRRGKLTSTDKANVMESGVLWREVVEALGASDYPDVELTHLYADNAAYQLGRDPLAFDVILGDNLFGDILSDQAGTIAGSLGMLPSASLPYVPRRERARAQGVGSRPALVLAIVVFLTMMTGAFVAGLKAGHIYNTFPKMGEGWIPPGLWAITPAYLNFFENPSTVQFVHRVVAMATFLAIVVFWIRGLRARPSPRVRLWLHLVAAAALVQVALGITTLLLAVPVSLAALHQAGADGALDGAPLSRPRDPGPRPGLSGAEPGIQRAMLNQTAVFTHRVGDHMGAGPLTVNPQDDCRDVVLRLGGEGASVVVVVDDGRWYRSASSPSRTSVGGSPAEKTSTCPSARS